ncbi:hypothetical protein ACTPEM_26850, partial [Clostridioides difficile]
TEWGAIDWIINKEPDLPIISITLEGNSQMSQLFSQKLLGDNYSQKINDAKGREEVKKDLSQRFSKAIIDSGYSITDSKSDG